MTLRLVSEARPIPEERLTKFELKLLQEADDWMNAVIADDNAKRPKLLPDELDTGRNGRVIFFDGPRGAGKTSLLLTLLERWRKVSNLRADRRVLLPVLDFDPLPRAMPLHGWLLEPWRKEAQVLEAKGSSGGSPKDLLELWADVFERAVIGWTQATIEGKGVVEKAIAYQEQASGWIETRTRWHEFVNAVVCRSVQCPDVVCNKTHPFIFIIAIDDIDLQVEQVPHLLHAIRLLHHPNVTYLLTGDYDHLRLVLKLDYIRRHTQHHPNVRRDGKLWNEIKRKSELLRDALLEKALPDHARVTLPMLSFQEVLNLAVDDGKPTHKTVADALGTVWEQLADLAHELRIVTARRAQHAIDKHNGRSKALKPEVAPEGKPVKPVPDELQFMANICGTSVEPTRSEESPWQFMLRGRLTTRLGALLRVWDGDQLEVVLTDRPSFAFLSEFDVSDTSPDDKTNRALVVQLAVERQLVVAPALDWTPEAGVAATQVVWNSESTKVGRTAVFHWPWLVRPSAAEALKLGDLSRNLLREMSGQMRGSGLSDLPESMVAKWLLENIKWLLNAPRKGSEMPSDWIALRADSQADAETAATLAEFTRRLKLLQEGADSEAKAEICRWARQLCVMTAPYFGLPRKLAATMRNAVATCVPSDELNGKKLSDEQKLMIDGAIIASVAGRPPSGRKSQQLESENDLSETELDALTESFLNKRIERSRTDDWWTWLKRRARSKRRGQQG